MTEPKVYYTRDITQDDVNDAEAFWNGYSVCEDATDRVVALCPTLEDAERVKSLLVKDAEAWAEDEKDMAQIAREWAEYDRDPPGS